MTKSFFTFASAALVFATSAFAAPTTAASYGKLPDGRDIQIFTLSNDHGLVAKVTEYGAVLVSVEVPDKSGHNVDLTLGYDTLPGWLSNTSFFGSSVGRFGNRIAHGKFTLDGKEYTLATNDHPGDIPCHLHGGKIGFNKLPWSGKTVEKTGAHGVQFTLVSKDGDEGYPGTLTTHVTYWLTDANELVWEVDATTDAPTILNIVHHSYWNLTGDPTKSINDLVLTLNASHYLPTDKGLIPTGEIAPVTGTPMDFTKPVAIGARVNENFEALKLGLGYDHAWVLDGKGLRTAAVLVDPVSGRKMEIITDQPAIQFYGGNFLDGKAVGKKGIHYAYRTGLCLESEGFPDSPNRASFPSPVLRPGQTYKHTMIHRFTF